MSDTATDTDTFTGIVAGIVPDEHMLCRICHPEGLKPGLEAVCGVKLLGRKPLPGAAKCGDCEERWGRHAFGHAFGGLGK